MTTLADNRTVEELLPELPGGPLRLVRVADLAPHIDRQRLLRDAAAPEPPYWMHLWPAARALARCVAEQAARFRGKRVLEIGCGLGLPGLAAARCGARVVLTDRNRDALALARQSAERNSLAVAAVAMDWATPALRAPFDLCLAADVTYDPSANRALVESLRTVLGQAGEVWIAESVRAEEPVLPDLLARRFTLSETRCAEIEEGHHVWVRVLKGRRR